MKKLLKAILLAGSVFNGFTGVQAQLTGMYYASVKLEIPVTTFRNPGNELNNGIVASGNLAPKHPRHGAGCTAIATAAAPPPRPRTALIIPAAILNISGHPDYTFAIVLPASCIITNTNNITGEATLSSSPSQTGKLNASGMQAVTIIATLAAPPDVPGSYSNILALPVTVNYN